MRQGTPERGAMKLTGKSTEIKSTVGRAVDVVLRESRRQWRELLACSRDRLRAVDGSGLV